MDSIYKKLQNIKNMMYDVFSIHKLVFLFLVYPESALTDYERRDDMLTEQERLNPLKNSSLLVSSALMCQTPT